MDGSALEQAGGARRAHAHALLATNANPTRKKPAFCPRSRCTRAAPPTALSAAVGFPEEAAEPRASVPASPHGGAKEGGGLPSAGAALPPSPLLPYEASTDPLRRIDHWSPVSLGGWGQGSGVNSLRRPCEERRSRDSLSLLGHGSCPPITQPVLKSQSGGTTPAFPSSSESKSGLRALGCGAGGSPRGQHSPLVGT